MNCDNPKCKNYTSAKERNNIRKCENYYNHTMKDVPIENIKDLFVCTEFEFMSENSLMVLWTKFSEIQFATCITFDHYSALRFIEWVKTGEDEKAWS